ncbi:MAG: hypothetical protein AB1782_10090 [Cyanobacteriota bacterium]
MFNKPFFLNLLIVSSFCLLFFSNNLYASQIATLEDSVNKYSLEFPSNWKLSKTPNAKDLIKATIEKDTNTGLQIRVYKNNKLEFKKFVDWYTNNYIKEMTTYHAGNINVLSKNFNKPGQQLKSVSSMDFTNGKKQRWFIKHYIWPREDIVYVIQSGCPYDKRNLIEPIINKIANSFKFLK